MEFKFLHNNINVRNLKESVDFYEKALGLKIVHRSDAEDGRYNLIFMGLDNSAHQLELTWLRDQGDKPYDLGDNESHLAFTVDDIDMAHEKHKEMGVIVFENEDMGIYFIADPDGYWIEIIPENM